jgi:hypothetical protein
VYRALWDLLFGRRERGEEGEWEDALLPPIPPILPLLPFLALPKRPAMLRCQIKRLKKTDPKEPYCVRLIIDCCNDYCRLPLAKQFYLNTGKFLKENLARQGTPHPFFLAMSIFLLYIF